MLVHLQCVHRLHHRSVYTVDMFHAVENAGQRFMAVRFAECCRPSSISNCAIPHISIEYAP